MTSKPKITRKAEIARTRIFKVESLSLEFSNGQTREYERMVSGGAGAVMVIAITKKNELVLIREYSAGTNDYQLGFPKGLVDMGEDSINAANRELQEEVGFGANEIVMLKKISLAPGYFTHQMEIYIAQNLYEKKLQGDEPEPLEIVYWPLSDVDRLLAQKDFTESRSIAGLYLALQYLANKNVDE